MRALLALLLVVSAAFVGLASEVKLAWDPSPTLGVTNYVLYASTNTLTATNRATANVRLRVGTNLTSTVEGLQTGRWTFAVTAMAGGLESDLSNVLAVEVPKSPANMRTVVLQYSGTLTNFYDVGFFRLRLP